jgi:aminopeptidase N
MRAKLIRSVSTAIAAVGALVAYAAAPASAAAGVGASGAGDPYFPLQGNGGYDVGHYALDLRYDPATDRLSGTVTISATATEALTRFDLDLRRELAVSSVTVNGVAASYAQPADLVQELVVTPAQPLSLGQGFTVAVSYAGVPPVITDPDNSIEGMVPTEDGVFTVGEPQGSPGWYPCNDTPTDKATYDFRATVPQGLTAVANGELVGTPTTSAGWTTFTWHSGQPMSTYLSTVTVGAFETSTGTTPAGIPYYLAVDPTAAAQSQVVLSKLPAIVDYFQSVYGTYPFSSAGAIVDPAKEVGYALETQTKPIFDRPPDELTLAHELAHQWYGDAVTLERWRDIWLNEGFAEFSSWLWSEHTGQASAQQFFDRWYAQPASHDYFWDPPPADPGDPAHIFAWSEYERGAMTLQALRVKLGDPTFFQIMRGWYGRHLYGNARVEDFTAYAQQVSGADLHHFFDVWLYQPGKPANW